MKLARGIIYTTIALIILAIPVIVFVFTNLYVELIRILKVM